MGNPDHDKHSDSSSSDDEDQVNANHQSPYRPYVPENTPPPAPYPPPQPVQFSNETYPPQQPTPFPPAQPVQFPPAQPVQFPPPDQSQSHENKFYAQPQVNYQAQGVAAVGVQYLPPTREWSAGNGLFDCGNDTENAIMTTFLPCVTFGQIAEVVDNGQSSCTTSGALYCLMAFTLMPCIMSHTYRTKIRSRYGLMETPAPDWITHCFCEFCALCQEFRELKAQGLNPAIGWQGNMIRNQQYSTMTPPMNQTMM